MVCAERMRLLIDYRDAARDYAEAVRDLTESVALDQESAIDALRKACRLTWDKTERCRLILARHEADHSCDRGAAVAPDKQDQ